MRTLVISIVFATLVTGCICGGYDGGGDVVFSRSTDQLILCENHGFVATLSTGAIEGRYTTSLDGTTRTAVRGDTGAVAFTLTKNVDGTATASELGTQPWNQMTLSMTDLDHADVQCQDLLTRSWWTTP